MNFNQRTLLKSGFLFLLKMAVFLGIALVLLTGASQVLKPKDNTPASGIKEPETRAIYTERENSLDVIAIGNSDIYAAYTPMQLWKDYGLASYVCGEPGQRVYEAYYLLKSVLEHQSPRVVVYETDEIFQNSDIRTVWMHILANVICAGARELQQWIPFHGIIWIRLLHCAGRKELNFYL